MNHQLSQENASISAIFGVESKLWAGLILDDEQVPTKGGRHDNFLHESSQSWSDDKRL